MRSETPGKIIDSELAGKVVLVTGATGFIGRHLVARLLEAGASVKVVVREARVKDAARLWQGAGLTQVVADLMDQDLPSHLCDQADTVFHLAGYAHAEDANDPRAANVHWQITVEATRTLLAQAAHSGVRRFVFVSSVKAMGEGGDIALDESSPAAPETAYGKAKRAAEKLVLAAGLAHGMHVCVLRLPLVYGPGGKGNLSRMISAIDRGRFPPISDTGNRRSMVHVDDVVQALLLAAEKPEADGQTYIVTDRQAYSTRQIYEWCREALGKPVTRWSVPLSVLQLAAKSGDIFLWLTGRHFFLDSERLGKLTGSAWYSSDKISRDLGFKPRWDLEHALPEMVTEYRKARES